MNGRQEVFQKVKVTSVSLDSAALTRAPLTDSILVEYTVATVRNSSCSSIILQAPSSWFASLDRRPKNDTDYNIAILPT